MRNKGPEIAAYINTLHSDIGETTLHSNTGNIPFDSIINFKLKNARRENIARAVEKHNGYMDITHDAQTFTAVVFLYIGG